MPKHLPTVIDLFCGAGGLSEGFRQAGFSVLAGNDVDPFAGRTFASTHGEAAFLPGPIESISGSDLLKAAGLKRGELDCLAGGPPCQAFSVYNHQRGMHDERSGLFREYLRVVEALMPKWVVMENVTGITSVGNGRAVEEIKKSLGRLGYEVETNILKAEQYGVPQERRRILFIGNRLGLPISWPDPTHGPGLRPLVSVSDALSDLPVLQNGEDRGDAPYQTAAQSTYQRLLRAKSKVVYNHSAPKLAQINMERMKYIEPGGSWRDIPIKLLPAGMRRAKRSDHTKRYGRLHPSGQSCTILTKCDLHWGSFIHPNQDRVITVREAARLQSFPDWFRFEGPRTEQYVQVGNAVPPLLARCIGTAIIESGFEQATKSRISAKERRLFDELAVA